MKGTDIILLNGQWVCMYGIITSIRIYYIYIYIYTYTHTHIYIYIIYSYVATWLLPRRPTVDISYRKTIIIITPIATAVKIYSGLHVDRDR